MRNTNDVQGLGPVAVERVLREETQILELLNKVGTAVAAELDLERAVQVVTDAATELSRAAFGAFFYNALDDKGEAYTLYTISGVSREAFSRFPMPRNTAVFAPTFEGTGIVRSEDITKDPRYGKNTPHAGMPKGHLPVRSYLAVPVRARSGEVLGGLFFGHQNVGVFDERAERLVAGIAVQAGIAIDKARLYRAAQIEIERRKQVEAALRESEETLEARVAERTAQLTARDSQLSEEVEKRQTAEGIFQILVEGVVDYAIYMLDPTGTITSWNTGAQRIKGYGPGEVIGLNFSRFFTDEDREAGLPARALEIAAREGKYETEGWRVRKDGSRFWANVVLDAIRDKSGILIGYAKITRDITERVQNQRALEKAREELLQSQKMDAIGQLTGGIAHDFNNLLMVILTSLELMRRRLPKDPAIISLLDNALQGAQRGTALTQRMLAFARRQQLSPESIDVQNLVRGMAELLQRSLGPTVSIETRFPLVLDAARADANQLELAILNLAMNARDAMPNGGPIVIAARNEQVGPGHASKLPPGRYVCLSVADSGEGMDEATLARAMEPFFTTKGVGKGTGLGLSMVHGMAEQSAGRLILKSRPGEGTTAELWLITAPGMKKTEGGESKPAVREPGETMQPLAVLAVDDDVLVLMNTAAMLEDLGHKAYSAHSGQEALDILGREDGIDLVITDQAMPQMTGIQLAQSIRAQRPDLPIILATGYAELPADTRGIL